MKIPNSCIQLSDFDREPLSMQALGCWQAQPCFASVFDITEQQKGEQQIACIQAISKSIQQIAAMEFPTYGSLYFADAPLDSASTLPLATGFCIGPHCGTRYWNCNAGEARYYNSTMPDRAPCEFLSSCCRNRPADWSAQGLILMRTATA